MLKITKEERKEIITHLLWRLRELGVINAILDNIPDKDPNRSTLEAYQQDLLSGYKGRGLSQKLNRVNIVQNLLQDEKTYNITSHARKVFETRLLSSPSIVGESSGLSSNSAVVEVLEKIFEFDWYGLVHREEVPCSKTLPHIEQAKIFLKNKRIEVSSLYAYFLEMVSNLENYHPFEVARNSKYQNATNTQLWILRETLMLMDHDMIYNHQSELFTLLYSYILSSNINPLVTERN